MAVSVPHKDLPRETAGEIGYDFTSGDSARRCVTCDYNLAQRLIWEMVGGVIPFGTNAIYKAPEKHPSNPRIVALNGVATGFGPITGFDVYGMPIFQKAKVFLRYGPPKQEQQQQTPPSQGSQTILTETRTGSVSVVTPAPGAFLWQEGPDNGKVLAEPPGVVVPEMTWTIQANYWNTNKVGSQLDDNIGKINASSFQASGLTMNAAAKCLRFDSWNATRSFVLTETGEILSSSWNVSLQFQYRRIPWDKIIHRDGNFYRISKSDNQPPLETTNFSTLFNF